MDKEELKEKTENITNTDSISDEEDKAKEELNQKDGEESSNVEKEEEKKLTPEEEIETLKDKLARTFAEMENQRRRFEKEKDDAYEYGGYSFAKEALNLLDNLERSKTALENDDNLKNTEALKKIVDETIKNPIAPPDLDKNNEIAIDMFFDSENYSLKIKYLSTEIINTNFGKILCHKIQPYVQSGRVFKKDESLTMWISADKNRIPMRIKADLIVGSIRIDLDSFSNLNHPFEIKFD